MRILIIVIALVVIAGGVWYYLGMPGYAPMETATAPAPATTPAAPASTTTPATP